MSTKPDIDKIEDAIVDIAARINRRTKQKSYKDFDDNYHISSDVFQAACNVAQTINKNSSTKKDIQSKLKEVAVACMLGIEYLERENSVAPGPSIPNVPEGYNPKA